MSAFVLDRLKRIAVPLVLFGAVMAVIIPPIWVYGWFGVWPPEVFREALSDRRTSARAATWSPTFGSCTTCCSCTPLWWPSEGFEMPVRVLRVVQPAWWAGLASRLGDAVYARFPMLLALGAVLLLILQAGNESKPLWPLNVPDVLYAALFFFYGYGLYARRELVERLKGDGALAALVSLAVVAYFAHLAMAGIIDETTKAGGDAETLDLLRLIDAVFYGFAAVLFSVGFIGLFERLTGSPRGWVRWLADSSYWVYIMHLPVVTFLTFLPRPPRPPGRAGGPDGIQLERRAEIPGGVRRHSRAGACDVPVFRQVHAAGDPAERQTGGRPGVAGSGALWHGM